ncbi:MAG: hypothetical protein ABIJ41_03250 [Candidatus Omnitrophota bacterium]
MAVSETLTTGLVLVAIIAFMILVPCVSIAWIGYRMIKQLSLFFRVKHRLFR